MASVLNCCGQLPSIILLVYFNSASFHMLQNDDVKLFEDQSDYWKVFLLSEDIVFKHGRQNYRMLKATSTGLGKLTASLSYFGGNDGMKKVICFSNQFFYS